MSDLDFELRTMGNELWELEGHRDQAHEAGRPELEARCEQRMLAIAKTAYDAAQAGGPHFEVACFVAGLALRMLGRWEEAEGGFRKLTETNPQNPEAWLELTGIYLELDRTLDALKAARNAAEQMPEEVEAWLNLAHCLQLVEEHDAAREALEAASELDPQNPRVAGMRERLGST